MAVASAVRWAGVKAEGVVRHGALFVELREEGGEREDGGREKADSDETDG